MPAVFFTWIPASQQDRNISLSPVAGFGVEGNNRPSIFVGGEIYARFFFAVTFRFGSNPFEAKPAGK